MLEYFDVNPMFVPTVVFYYPEKNKYAHLIGKFDKETVQAHEQKFISGRLATFDPRVKAKDIQVNSLDCPNIHLQIDNTYTEIDDEILQEIIAEEAAKKKEMEEELAKTSKKKKSKKKKQPKSSKEDL